MEPWWVVVAAVTYAESARFNVPPALAIALRSALGLCWDVLQGGAVVATVSPSADYGCTVVVAISVG
jgi:hypothetical protein